jgi:hypothetical protein
MRLYLTADIGDRPLAAGFCHSAFGLPPTPPDLLGRV